MVNEMQFADEQPQRPLISRLYGFIPFQTSMTLLFSIKHLRVPSLYQVVGGSPFEATAMCHDQLSSSLAPRGFSILTAYYWLNPQAISESATGVTARGVAAEDAYLSAAV